jgi:hypothetical protein
MLDLDVAAAEICSNVGKAFPDQLDHRGEMILRQLLALAEEATELDEALELHHVLGTIPMHDHLGEEIVDTILTAHMVAFYVQRPLSLVVEKLEAEGMEITEAPYRVAGRAVKAGRRFLGIARRTGDEATLYRELASLVLACKHVARREFVLLDQAVAAKLQVIFSRGWKESAPCAG